MSINHLQLWIIPSDFRSSAVPNPHHLILLISNSYENAKAKRLRFGYRICKLSMNFRMCQHPSANNGASRTQSQTCLSYAEAQPIECNAVANMPLICGNRKSVYPINHSYAGIIFISLPSCSNSALSTSVIRNKLSHRVCLDAVSSPLISLARVFSLVKS